MGEIRTQLSKTPVELSAGDKSRGGRPKGISRCTCVRSGAYSSVEQLPNILKAWKKYSPGNYHRAMAIIDKYLRLLRWDQNHPRFGEVRDLSVRTVSRSELFLILLQKDFTRRIRDKHTGHFIKLKPCDQILLMEKIDLEIQQRLLKLGIIGNRVQAHHQEDQDQK
ncbi:MAG: hypothetical protein ABIE92_00110 [bacterium]